MGIVVKPWELKDQKVGVDVSLTVPAEEGKFHRLHALVISIKPWQQLDWDVRDGGGVLLMPGSGPAALAGLDIVSPTGKSLRLKVISSAGAEIRLFAQGETVTIP